MFINRYAIYKRQNCVTSSTLFYSNNAGQVIVSLENAVDEVPEVRHAGVDHGVIAAGLTVRRDPGHHLLSANHALHRPAAIALYIYIYMFVCVYIYEPFFWGGGVQSILFSLFWNNKASFKYIYTLNGIHI